MQPGHIILDRNNVNDRKTARSVKCYSLKSQSSKNSDLSSGLELTFVPSSTSKFFYLGCEKWSDRTSGGSKFVDEGFDIDHPSNNQGNQPEMADGQGKVEF